MVDASTRSVSVVGVHAPSPGIRRVGYLFVPIPRVARCQATMSPSQSQGNFLHRALKNARSTSRLKEAKLVSGGGMASGIAVGTWGRGGLGTRRSARLRSSIRSLAWNVKVSGRKGARDTYLGQPGVWSNKSGWCSLDLISVSPRVTRDLSHKGLVTRFSVDRHKKHGSTTYRWRFEIRRLDKYP